MTFLSHSEIYSAGLGCGSICGVPVDPRCAACVGVARRLELSVEALMLRWGNRHGTRTSNGLSLKLGQGPLLHNSYVDIIRSFTQLYAFPIQNWSIWCQMSKGNHELPQNRVASSVLPLQGVAGPASRKAAWVFQDWVLTVKKNTFCPPVPPPLLVKFRGSEVTQGELLCGCSATTLTHSFF